MTPTNPLAEAVERVRQVVGSLRYEAATMAGTPTAARQRLDYAADLTLILQALSAKDAALTTIRDATDPDSPENYRQDDREGCLDMVFFAASSAMGDQT